MGKLRLRVEIKDCKLELGSSLLIVVFSFYIKSRDFEAIVYIGRVEVVKNYFWFDVSIILLCLGHGQNRCHFVEAGIHMSCFRPTEMVVHC